MTSENEDSIARSDSAQPQLVPGKVRIEELSTLSAGSCDTSELATSAKRLNLHAIPPQDLRIAYDVEQERKRLTNRRSNRPPETGSSFGSSQ